MTPQVLIACYRAAIDGFFYPRWPNGDNPNVGVALASAAVDATSALGALSGGTPIAGMATDTTAAIGALKVHVPLSGAASDATSAVGSLFVSGNLPSIVQTINNEGLNPPNQQFPTGISTSATVSPGNSLLSHFTVATYAGTHPTVTLTDSQGNAHPLEVNLQGPTNVITQNINLSQANFLAWCISLIGGADSIHQYFGGVGDNDYQAYHGFELANAFGLVGATAQAQTVTYAAGGVGQGSSNLSTGSVLVTQADLPALAIAFFSNLSSLGSNYLAQPDDTLLSDGWAFFGGSSANTTVWASKAITTSGSVSMTADQPSTTNNWYQNGIAVIRGMPATTGMYVNGAFSGAWANGQNLSSGSVNFTYTTNPASPHTESIYVPANGGLQYASDWAPIYQGGTNGVDISSATWLQFDLDNLNGSGVNLVAHYMRGDEFNGADIQSSTSVPSLAAVPGIGSIAAGWKRNVRLPLAYLALLSSFNYYKWWISGGSNAIQLDNIKFVAGNVAWIYRGNTSLETGWTDASTNASTSYSFLPQTLNGGTGGLFAINNPPRAAANFTGLIVGNVLTISSQAGGAIANGDQLFFGTSSGQGPTNCTITGGSGSSRTLSQNLGNVGPAGMMTVQPQATVCAASVSVIASGGMWRANYSSGFSVSPYSNFTFAALPTQTGNVYQVQAYNTSNAAIGNAVNISAGSLIYTCNDFGVNVQNWTVYCIPMSALNIRGQTIGGISIKDTSGNSTNVIRLSAIGFFN